MIVKKVFLEILQNSQENTCTREHLRWLLPIISFRIISKITVNRRKNGLRIIKLCRKYFPCDFLRFWYVFLNSGFQSYLNRQNHLQSWYEVTLLPQLVSLWCIYWDIWAWYTLIEESEIVDWRSSIKKGVLKNSTKFTWKYPRWGLFCNKATG